MFNNKSLTIKKSKKCYVMNYSTRKVFDDNWIFFNIGKGSFYMKFLFSTFFWTKYVETEKKIRYSRNTEYRISTIAKRFNIIIVYLFLFHNLLLFLLLSHYSILIVGSLSVCCIDFNPCTSEIKCSDEWNVFSIFHMISFWRIKHNIVCNLILLHEM